MTSKKRLIFILAGGALVLVVAYRLTWPGAVFLVRYMDSADVRPMQPSADSIVVHGNSTFPVRVFTPRGPSSKTVLLVHGVHHKGYDEPRLLHFARTLVGLDFTVVVPDFHDLKNYALTGRAVDEIEQSALWVLDDSGLVEDDDTISIFGISFAGGLSLSAAARKSLTGRVSTIFAFGGHGDLDKTLEYLLTGMMPDGVKLPAHIYGGAVVARWFADRLVPPDQVEALKNELHDYLSGQGKKVRERAPGLPIASKTIVELCLERDDVALGALLSSRIGKYSMDDVLSPVRGPVPSAGIFLLHGSSDNVIPPSESQRLEQWAKPHTSVTVLVSDLIGHVEPGENDTALSLSDYWAIIRFWTELLRSD